MKNLMGVLLDVHTTNVLLLFCCLSVWFPVFLYYVIAVSLKLTFSCLTDYKETVASINSLFQLQRQTWSPNHFTNLIIPAKNVYYDLWPTLNTYGSQRPFWIANCFDEQSQRLYHHVTTKFAVHRNGHGLQSLHSNWWSNCLAEIILRLALITSFTIYSVLFYVGHSHRIACGEEISK